MAAQNSSPTVTFLVPCYKLAHFLEECVGSMLAQTYRDFEVLVLDDCSPDNTPEVAARIGDPRVRLVRHAQNMGHLRNYNEGIRQSRGKYIWLISADDKLKDPRILERYVEVMERNPNVGYVFCPAVELRDTTEMGVMEWTRYAREDRIMRGRPYFREIINGNLVAAPTGMVRKTAYDKCGGFPLDLPHTGDWYLWSLFSLYFDVAFLAEPMVLYRTHGENMSLALRRKDGRIVRNNLNLARWKLRARAVESGDADLVRASDAMLGNRYGNEIGQTLYHQDPVGPTLEEFDAALSEHVASPAERSRIRATLYSTLADQAFRAGNVPDARAYYGKSLAENPSQPLLVLKRMMLRFGKLGNLARGAVKRARGIVTPGSQTG
jgi:glycosyltransferase involved in cell wall biosynthesis